MLLRLTLCLESRLEFTLLGRNYKGTEVSLRSSLNHIRDVVFVTWCIKDGPALSLCLEVLLAILYRYAPLLFLLNPVHGISIKLRIAIFLHSLTLVSSHLIFRNELHGEQQIATESRLSCINVPDKYYAARLLGFINCFALCQLLLNCIMCLVRDLYLLLNSLLLLFLNKSISGLIRVTRLLIFQLRLLRLLLLSLL